MKTLFIIMVVLAAVAGFHAPAAAGNYTVGFFADESATSCEITNVTPEVVKIHMLLYGSATTANGAAFYAPTPDCWTGAVWLGDEINDAYLFLGSTHSPQYGLSLAFTACRSLPLRLGSMGFWAGGSEPCCTYRAYPLPEGHTGIIEVVTCAIQFAPATSESVIINPDESCTCTASTIVSTEPSTWGRVKALYR